MRCAGTEGLGFFYRKRVPEQGLQRNKKQRHDGTRKSNPKVPLDHRR